MPEFLFLKACCDEGIKNARKHLGIGRLGARLGPDAVEAQLKKITSTIPTTIKLEGSMNDVYAELEKTVSSYIEGRRVIVVGGSDDLIAPAVKGLALACNSVGGIHVDPHLDVRPYDTAIFSGSGNRIILDKVKPKKFIEFGDSEKSLPEHVAYVHSKKGEIIFMNKALRNPLTLFSLSLEKICSTACAWVNIDMDCIEKQFAPGVSAPAEKGFLPEHVKKFARTAARKKEVRLFSVMETSPPLDFKDNTAKLAAEIIASFLSA